MEFRLTPERPENKESGKNFQAIKSNFLLAKVNRYYDMCIGEIHIMTHINHLFKIDEYYIGGMMTLRTSPLFRSISIVPCWPM